MKTIALSSERLTLTPFHAGLVSDRYVGWLNDPEVVRYSEQRHRHHTRDSCLSFVETIDHENAHMWAINNGSHIGNITAHREHDTADIGLLIGQRSEWGKGYGLEAWSTVMRWLHSTGSRIVTGGTRLENAGMILIFERSGMIETKRDADFVYYSARRI